MRSHHLFLLLYLVASCCATTFKGNSNGTCGTRDACAEAPGPTSHFLRCVGLPSTETGKDHMLRLKGIIEASLDIYSFMRSSMEAVPFLELKAAMELNPGGEAFQDQDLVKVWLEVKIRPLLHSISKHFLTCLSTKNFSCATYQTVVRELSHRFSDMDADRQKWIYTFFMYPFLSREGPAGCVRPDQSSEEWLMKNFGSFGAMARMKDFAELNAVFSGLEVLHLLTPEQKAELLLRPEVAGLDNGTLSLVFHSLMSEGHGPPTPGPPGPAGPGDGHNWTSPGYPHGYTSRPMYHPYLPPSPLEDLKQVVGGFWGAVRPIGSLVSEFTSLTRKEDVSEIRSTTLVQVLMNWTLAELATLYRPHNASVAPQNEMFDVTDVEDWYNHVVIPMLRRFLTDGHSQIHDGIKLAFHNVFFLDNGMDNDTSELEDTCSVTIDKRACGLTNAVEDVARVLHCMARTNLTLNEVTITSLVEELMKRLNVLAQEFSTANFREVASHFREVFARVDSPALTKENLEDPAFVRLWFRIKLLPLLPALPGELLSCLSTKNFTCAAFRALVAELSEHMERMDHERVHGRMIYKHFIHPFLLHRDSDSQCLSSANRSAEWLEENFGFFSMFAPVNDFYHLNPHFSGLQSLRVLTPLQIAQLLVLPLPPPPEKEVVVHGIFDFLTESQEDREFTEVVHHAVQLAKEVNPPCGVIRAIVERLYKAMQSVPLESEPFTYAHIDKLMQNAPQDCLPHNFTCPVTQFNGSKICAGIDSDDLQHYLNTTDSMAVPCNFTLEKFACTKLENFTAHQLVSLLKCNLPGNSSLSMSIWKMLLVKLTPVLDPALDLLANMTMAMVGPSASEVLDVVGELRVGLLTDEQLREDEVMRKWFSGRLRVFLSSASGRFLHCLSNRNLSCQAYQQILQAFGHQFANLTVQRQNLVVRELVHPVLSRPRPDRGCVSNATNSSVQWLQMNLGPFSVLLSLREILDLNPSFSPLEALALLSPKQSAELLVLPSPADKKLIIKAVFDHLTQSPVERRFPGFLSHLLMFSREGKISCSSYKMIFNKLDQASPEVPLNVAASIDNAKLALFTHIPPGCIIYSGECNDAEENETAICAGVNSTSLQLHLNNGTLNGSVCDFGIEEYACASLSALGAEGVAAVLKCNRLSLGSKPVWKLFLSKTLMMQDRALDLLSNMTFDPRDPGVALLLDSIGEVRLHTFSTDSFQSPSFIHMWFGQRLRPFLPAVSSDFLSCLSTRSLSCSTFQAIVQILSRHRSQMEPSRQISVYTQFIRLFLTRNGTADPSCSNDTNSGEWLEKNFGGFSDLVSFHDLQQLYPGFAAMEALPQLSVRQLAGVSSTPGQLTTSAQVAMVMNHVPNHALAAFFDDFSPAVTVNQTLIPSVVRSAMLQVVFDRANLSDHSVSDAEVLTWLHNRLRPLLLDLSPLHVAPFFNVVAGRNCSTEQQAVMVLNSTHSTLNEVTQGEIFTHIIQSLRGPMPLRCYGDNNNHSFYAFLEGRFMGFQFPNLTTFLSLMPADRMHQLVNSMPPTDLADFLRRPNTVDNDGNLCHIYNNFVQTPVFIETEALPDVVRRPTLPCIWPTALYSAERSEVNAWFDRRLPDYLGFLTKDLLTSSATHNASCLAFQKLVRALGKHNYNAADFTQRDVFDTIRSYLTTVTVPRCYDANSPELNSTAWFVEYIGPFMPFLSLEDLNTFGSPQVLNLGRVIQVFTVNPLNIALINHSALPLNLTNYWTELVYSQDSNFDPLLLPLLCRCVAPGPAFSQLTAAASVIVLHNLTTNCVDLDPQISTALAANFGDNLDASSIAALGNESTSISTGQIKMAKPADLFASLGVLSAVNGWNQGQARAVIQMLVSSGMLQVDNGSALAMLGSLVVGVPASTISSISGSSLLAVSKNTGFLAHLMIAPVIIRQTFVTQIISVDSNSEKIIENVPDELATEIPRALLQGFPSSGAVVNLLNKKTWKHEQAVLIFDTVVNGMADQEDNLSSYVLQGFTCTRVVTLTRRQITRLVRASRRNGKGKGRRRVKLRETQLTCMYNYVKAEADATNFALYPPDVLLYYDYSLVPQAGCRSYFQELSDADFSVFSSALSFKRSALFSNARGCLNITGTALGEDTILVLGNMVCTLDGSYIQNSHPSILEKLKNCPDLNNPQVAAMETLLLSGTTTYGAASTWNGQTLNGLGILPLYLTKTFYDNFDKKTKRTFLRAFQRTLRANGTEKRKIRRMRRAIRKSIRNLSKRSIDCACTVGQITQVTIGDETFPFDYADATQFNCCLSAETVRTNLAAITQKVDDEDYLRIVLDRLRQAYDPTIPEDQVLVLGLASRTATSDDVSAWTITVNDTLAALMDPSDGEWDPALAKSIITKYLSTEGNSLGTVELNSIRGANLCTLDVSVLRTISKESLSKANALTVSTCILEQKKELFAIASAGSSRNTRAAVSPTEYQLIEQFLGGADSEYIQNLAGSNINMDMETFVGLDENVIMALNVDQVRGLLGTNLPELKSYENQPVVQSWTRAQLQSDLDKLDVALSGGRADPTTTAGPAATTAAPAPAASTATTPAATTPPSSATASPSAATTVTTGGAAATTTGSGGARARPDHTLSFLVFLILFITSQDVLQG